MELVLAMGLGFALDLCFGDPHWMPHPVVFIGKLISALERLLRRRLPATPKAERLGGVLLVILVLGVTVLVSWGILLLLGWIHPIARFMVEVFWCYQILATRCLAQEAKKVQNVLETGDLTAARTAVGYLVGRDTQSLTAAGVTKATVETVAENTSDGVVAPLCFLALGGPVLGFAYKAVNTMDSMVGYRNERYQYFGTAAARLDDLLNWIPARLSAFLMMAAAALCGRDAKGAFRIWRRDRRNHKSPNSAQTESVCAGALGVQLAGSASYFGTVVQKPTIGDDLRPIEPRDISRTCALLYGTAVLSLVLLLAIRICL